MQDPPLGLRRGAEPTDVPQWLRLSGGPSKIHPRLRLRLFALDPYDVALAKIERNSARVDVKHLARVVPFDLEILKQRYRDELRVYLGNPEREDVTLKLWLEMIEENRL